MGGGVVDVCLLLGCGGVVVLKNAGLCLCRGEEVDGVTERKLAWCWLPGLAVVVDETAKGLEDAGDGGGVHGLPHDTGKELEGFGVGCCI